MEGWSKFLSELAAEEAWDSERASPHSPEMALRGFLAEAGSAAVADLIPALSSENPSVRDYACRGLEWLGPAAGPDAVDALTECVRARRDIWVRAAVAIEAINPPKLRALGVLAEPGVVKAVLELLIRRGIDDVWPLVDEVLSDGLEPPGLAVLGSLYLRAMARERCPSMLEKALLEAGRGHASAAVRAAAADFLGDVSFGVPAGELVELLAKSGGATMHTVTRLACHPSSGALIADLVARKDLGTLAILLTRRRSAGFGIDPRSLRALLAAELERPEGTRLLAEYEIRNAAECAAQLGDPELLGSLVRAVVLQKSGHGWNALFKALRRHGEEARARLSAIVDPSERVVWMIGALDRPTEDPLAVADGRFRAGRIEASVQGAFEAYADALLLASSAHAAFQLAWIDRAFGAEIPPARVDWIAGLGFGDRGLLAELARPIERPLNGLRFHWDGGEHPKADPERAERALAAALPSLAAHWSPETRYREAAEAQLARLSSAG